MSIDLFSPLLDASWDNYIVPNEMPMDVELLEDPCPVNRELLERFLAQFSALTPALQNVQIPKIEKYIRSMLAREVLDFCLELLDRLPEAIAREAAKNSQVELMQILGYQEHSRAMALLQIACMKPFGNTLHILQSLFMTSMHQGICPRSEFCVAMRILFACQHRVEVINFVSNLQSPAFEEVMRALDEGGVFVEKDLQGTEWILHFLHQRLERTLQWLFAQHDNALLSFVGHQSLIPFVREIVSQKLQNSQFQFVLSLLMAHSDARRAALIASIPHWVVDPPGHRTNLVHWLYAQASPEAHTCLCSLINALPCGELLRLWSAQDENWRLPQTLSQESHNLLQPFLNTRVGNEWNRITPQNLSFSEVLTFQTLRRYDFCTISAEQFIQGVSSSPDVACRDLVRYYHEFERGWLRVLRYQNEHHARRPVLKDTLVRLAIHFAEGPLVFAEALGERKKIELRMQEAIVRSHANYSSLRADFCQFRRSLLEVTRWAFERGLEALRHQNVSMDIIRSFLARRLSLSDLEKLVEIVERSLDPTAHEALPALRAKFQFWRQFFIFVDSASRAKNVTFDQVTKVYQNISGMSGKALSGAQFPFSDLVNVMGISVDERCRRIAMRYATISLATYGSVSFETETPSEASKLCEAYYIEITIPGIHQEADCILRRAETKLLRPLQYCPTTRRVYLLSRFAYAASFSSGTFKMATPAIELSQDDLLFSAEKIRLFTVGSKWIRPITQAAEMRHLLNEEIPRMKELGGHPGFLGFRSLVQYPYVRSCLNNLDAIVQKEEQKISMIVDCAQKLRPKHVVAPYTLREQVMIGREVGLALDALHERGRIHGDFKEGNCMIVPDRQEKGRIGAIVIDFGFTEKVQKGLPVSVIVGVSSYNNGFYGTITMTAPELFGVQNFAGDHFKVEAFAMGFFLYFLKYGHDPVWGNIIRNYYYGDSSMWNALRTAQRSLQHEVQQEVCRLRRSIQGQGETSPDVRYTKVVCGLLDPNPAERWTVYQAAFELNKLLMDITPPVVMNSVNVIHCRTQV